MKSAVLHECETSRDAERVEVTAQLTWSGGQHRLSLSAPLWLEPWLDDSHDAFVLAALPWLESSGERWRLIVRGVVSDQLVAGLKHRDWLRRERGDTSASLVKLSASKKAVPPASSASRATGVAGAAGAVVSRAERAVLHYPGGLSSVVAALELAAESPLYVRPTVAVSGGAVPGGSDDRLFLERLGLRHAEVRLVRPGPVAAEGGDLDGAARLRWLSAGFATGYLPATEAYHLATSRAGEPDADIDPLFSGGDMRIIHFGAERILTGKFAALRGLKADELPPAACLRTGSEAPPVLLEAGLALAGVPAEFSAEDLLGLDFGTPLVRRSALGILCWLREEPDLAASSIGLEIGAKLRAGLGLAPTDALPKMDVVSDPLATASRIPEPWTRRIWRGRSEAWEDGLALVSEDRGLVNMNLEPLVSWIRLRYPHIKVGAARTRDLLRAVQNRGLKPPRMVVDLHETRGMCAGLAGVFCGAGFSKADEMMALERIGVAVPRWRVLSPGDTLDEKEFGKYVVVKPVNGLRGACVRVQKTRNVKTAPIYVETTQTSSAPFVQEYIHTGPRPVSHRIGVVFGKAIYRWRVEGRAVEGRELPVDGDFKSASGVSVVSTGTGCEFSDPWDMEVIAFAERAAQAFPRVPLMGVDVIRRPEDGRLFVLELNSCGFCFHLTSDTGVKIQQTTRLQLPEQYGGYRYIADLYVRAYERFTGERSDEETLSRNGA